ncbi:CapA family protein [Halobacillus sp. Marseille-Q1614]|uniref:CapA family protein n=1 Tax=Halobacillus sp. Marseille-Q1614 TaxID=2709134 RepID=UPI001570CA66|nr:CapA family protein [Halobacillus sp. Marseille-Q1614]
MTKKLNVKEKILKQVKWHKKRAALHTLLATLCVAAIIYPLNEWLKPSSASVEEKESMFTASIVGDIMFGRYVNEVTSKHSYDHHFDKVRSLLENSDYVSGNLEHPVVTNENIVPIEKPYNFKTEPEAVTALKNANFTVANLANNNTLDYGVQGLTETIQTFNEAELGFVGAGQSLAEAEQIHYAEYNGITVATLGFNDILNDSTRATESGGGVLGADPQTFLPLIKEADENADLVFVNVHWGKEYEHQVEPKQRDYAHAMADAGADAIFGSHPHVLSPVEKYKDTMIFYSLGNFIFDQGWSRTKESAIVQYNLQEDGRASYEIHPAFIEETQPALLTEKNKYRSSIIRRKLTKNLEPSDWSKEGNRIVIDVDHSDVVKKEEFAHAE